MTDIVDRLRRESAGACCPARFILCEEAADQIERLRAEVAEKDRHLKFIERWANHHGAKPSISPQEALAVIQHYPPIKDITRGYVDGVVPDTPDPWAEVERLTGCLKKANDLAEHFEREWYLRGYEVERLYSMIPGVVYMDPPDGGSVTRIEQMQRMAEDAARYRFVRVADRIPISAHAARDPVAYDAAIDAAMAQEPRG